MASSALDNPSHKSRFERSKAFSDYLGFHIRLAFFGVIGLFALAIPVSRMLAEYSGGPPYSPVNHVLELAIMVFCFTMSGTMLFHIFGVGRTFLVHHVPIVRVRYVIYPIYWVLTIGSLAAISMYGSFQLLSTLNVDAYEFECLMNAFLKATDYPFTPETPQRCQ